MHLFEFYWPNVILNNWKGSICTMCTALRGDINIGVSKLLFYISLKYNRLSYNISLHVLFQNTIIVKCPSKKVSQESIAHNITL